MREETGLIILPLAKFGAGELIRSQDYHRAAHFVHIDIVADTIAGAMMLDQAPVELPAARARSIDLISI